VTDRSYAEFPKIVGRQIAQHRAVDFVAAESGLVLLQPEAAQPSFDVHGRLLSTRLPARSLSIVGYSMRPSSDNNPEGSALADPRQPASA
jgi:hypothetical protein